jgi:hypothetical protein
MPFTLEDIANFCYDHRRFKGFKEFAFTEVCETVLWAANNDKLVWVHDDEGVCGVCIYTVHKPLRTIYVHHIVATRTGFVTLIEQAKRQFPDYNIAGLRNGKVITFNKKHLWQIPHKAQARRPAA